jgi:hypothetical protein
MNEDVLASIIRLDKAEAFLAVKPLHSSCGHVRCLLFDENASGGARAPPVGYRVLENVVSNAAFAPEANSFGRNSMDTYSAFERFSKVALDDNKYRGTSLPIRFRRTNLPNWSKCQSTLGPKHLSPERFKRQAL